MLRNPEHKQRAEDVKFSRSKSLIGGVLHYHTFKGWEVSLENSLVIFILFYWIPLEFHRQKPHLGLRLVMQERKHSESRQPLPEPFYLHYLVGMEPEITIGSSTSTETESDTSAIQNCV